MKAALVVVLAHLAFAAFAIAGSPAGPRLATVEMIETKASQRSEDEGPPLMALASVDPSTGEEQRFLRSPLEVSGRVTPSPFYGPAWSADGGLIAFNAHVGESDRGKIFVFAPGGGGARALPRTENGTNPVFSPDGHTLAFARTRTRIHIDLEHITEPGKSRSRFYSSTTTWVVDLGGGNPRRLTRWRNGLSNVPTSFTADGSGLLVTKEDSHLDGPRIVRLGLADGGPEEIAQGATEGVLSPDAPGSPSLDICTPTWSKPKRTTTTSRAICT